VKKGKANAKPKTPAKKAPVKKVAAKKVATVKAAPQKAVFKPVEESVLATPAKGDIVVAMGKYFKVMTSSKRAGSVVAAPVHMIECGMTGANFHREVTWDIITAIYKDAGYRG
jgi:uncharacterized protein (DUF697 family)